MSATLICPICWTRRKIQNARARVVTELRLPDGSIMRTAVSLREHHEARPAWPAHSALVFTTVAYGRRAARRVTAESLRKEMEWMRLVSHLPVGRA